MLTVCALEGGGRRTQESLLSGDARCRLAVHGGRGGRADGAYDFRARWDDEHCECKEATAVGGGNPQPTSSTMTAPRRQRRHADVIRVRDEAQ